MDKIDKESVLIYLRFVEKLILLFAKYSKAGETVNIIRNNNYYAHVLRNPPETPMAGLTTYAGIIKRIQLPREPTVAIMLSGKGPTIDTDFHKKPIEVYYIIEDSVKEVSEDAKIIIERGGFRYVRPRVGTPEVDLPVKGIDKLAWLIYLDLKKMIERRFGV